ncbi:hypothetical protein CEP53_000724 [Fusarium sp. AF-6]|nr:hypothetical protein CEP53_000724 [Fusarium sp. AF-6]
MAAFAVAVVRSYVIPEWSTCDERGGSTVENLLDEYITGLRRGLHLGHARPGAPMSPRGPWEAYDAGFKNDLCWGQEGAHGAGFNDGAGYGSDWDFDMYPDL